MKLSSLLFSALLAAASIASAAADDNHPATTQQMKDQERVDIEKRTNELPIVGPMTIEKAVRIAMRDGRIVAATDAVSDETEHHVLLASDASYCTLLVRQLSGGDHAAEHPAPNLQFLRYDFSDPSIVFVHEAVFTHPGYAQLVADAELGAGTREVTLLDQAPTVDEQGQTIEGGTSLRVKVDNGGELAAVDFYVTAPDLAALNRAHPSEVNTYLRPLLRDFHAESILKVDPLLAWGAFGPEKALDPNVKAQVMALLKELDSPSFAQRSAATDALKKLGTPGAIALMQLDRNELSAEQNSRLQDVLSAYQPLTPQQAEMLANQTGFLLDCMASDELEIRRMALARLTKKLGHDVDFDVNAPADSRQASLDSLRQKLLPPPATRSTVERE